MWRFSWDIRLKTGFFVTYKNILVSNSSNFRTAWGESLPFSFFHPVVAFFPRILAFWSRQKNLLLEYVSSLQISCNYGIIKFSGKSSPSYYKIRRTFHFGGFVLVWVLYLLMNFIFSSVSDLTNEIVALICISGCYMDWFILT